MQADLTIVLDLNNGSASRLLVVNITGTLTQQPRGAAANTAKPPHSLAVNSIGLGIPITAICLGTTGGGPSGIAAMLIAWVGIAAVNVAHIRRP